MQELERRSGAGQCRLPVDAQLVHTPLRAEAWQSMLVDHPDKELVEWMVRGIRQGFRLGFQQDRRGLRQARQNLASVREHPEVVQEYLDNELEKGRVIAVGKTEEADALGVHCSPFGVIPKKGKAGRWRLIVDLSAPAEASVNDGISSDVKQAYRNMPVHPDDRGLLGMQWQGELLVDGCLPFGLRSAPLLFTVAADLL